MAGNAVRDVKVVIDCLGNKSEPVRGELRNDPPPFGFAKPGLRATIRLTIPAGSLNGAMQDAPVSLYEDGKLLGKAEGWRLKQDEGMEFDAKTGVSTIYLEHRP